MAESLDSAKFQDQKLYRRFANALKPGGVVAASVPVCYRFPSLFHFSWLRTQTWIHLCSVVNDLTFLLIFFFFIDFFFLMARVSYSKYDWKLNYFPNAFDETKTWLNWT